MGATFLDAYLSDFSFHVQHSFSKELKTEIHLRQRHCSVRSSLTWPLRSDRSCDTVTPPLLPPSSLPSFTPSSPPSDGRIAERGDMKRHGRSMPRPQLALQLLRHADHTAAPSPAVAAATAGDRVALETVKAASATGDRRDPSNRSSSSSSARPRRLKKEELKEDRDPSSEVAALKTPRRVVPSQIDVSSGDKLHLLPRSEFALAGRALPLFSTTAHARQAQINLDGAAQDGAYIAAVRNAYNTITSAKSSVSISCLSAPPSIGPT